MASLTTDQVQIIRKASCLVSLESSQAGEYNWSERRCADDVVTIVLGIIFLLSSSFSGRRKKAARVLNFCMGS